MLLAIVAVTTVLAITATSALAYEIPSDYQHTHYTATDKGGPQVCGLHLCKSDEIPAFP